MVDLLGERGNKNQGVQHKKCQQPDAAKNKRNQPEHNCHNQQSCRFGFVQQAKAESICPWMPLVAVVVSSL
jgi:hypothetical protein